MTNVNKATSSLSKELRGINSLLKLDPKNTELLAQKQTVLKQSIEQTTKKVESLKEAQQRFIESGGDLNSAEYRTLQREIINTENKLKQFKLEASNWTKVSKSLDNVSSKMRNLGSKISSVGQKMSVITAGLVTLGGIGVKSAMEQESAMQQVKNIYGEASKTIENFAENTAIAYNMSTKEAYKYAQVYGNLIQSITNDEEENAQYTQQLLKASSVIASSTGRTMEDVMDRIRSGLLGNTEAIEDLGVNVNVALLESTDAFKKFAGDKSWNQLDFQTQQQIRLFGILEQTTKKYGNEVQQNTATNVQELNAKMQNLGNTLGEKLLPYFNKIVDKATELVDKFSNLSPKTQDLIIKTGMLVAVIGPLLLIIGKIISFGGTIASIGSKLAGVIAKITTSTGGLSGAMTVLTGPVGIVIAVVTALIGAFVLLWQKSETFRNSMAEVGNSIVNTYNNHIKPAIDNIKEILLTLWNDAIVPLANFLWETFGPILEQVFTSAGKVIAIVFEKIGIIIKAVTGVLKGLINFITGVFSGDWEKAWQGVKDIFGNIFNGIKELFKKPINWIIDKLNSFLSGLNGIKIPDWVPGVGGASFNIPQIPKLAKGGIVDKATLAMIGEGKSAEAVIPLDKTLTKYMAEAMKQAGGTGTINVNFYPQHITEAELDRAFNYIDRRFGLAY